MPNREQCSDDYHEAYADWADRALRAEAEIKRLQERHERDMIHVREAHAARRVAEAEVERLREERDDYKAIATRTVEQLDLEVREEVTRLREQHERDLIQVREAHEARRKAWAEVERLREALRFYAKGWTPGSQQYREDCDDAAVHGQRAREALAKDRTGSQDEEWPEGSGPLGF